MTTAITLYRLDESLVIDEYVEALFGELKEFLLTKNNGHCQRIDYLPRTVMDRLGQRLAGDNDLKDHKIVCRVVTDRTNVDLQEWEVTGSGAVARREDATYGRIKVFCALFPAGLRLAEEDSLNVATFKTDDATSFHVKKCLEKHVKGKVNLQPEAEKAILTTILNAECVRGLDVRWKLRYALSVLGQKELSNSPINWETAGAYLFELRMIPDFELPMDSIPAQLQRNQYCTSILADGEKTLAQNLERLVTDQGFSDSDKRNDLAVFLANKNTLRPQDWLHEICYDENLRNNLSFDSWTFSEPIKDVRIELKAIQDPNNPAKVAKGLDYRNGTLSNDGKKQIQITWKVSPVGTDDIGGYKAYVIRSTEDDGDVDVITPVSIPKKRMSFMIPMENNNLEDDEKCVARIRLVALDNNGIPIQNANDESTDFWIEQGDDESETAPTSDRAKKLRHLKEVYFRATHESGKKYEARSKNWDAKKPHVYSVRLTNHDRGDLVLNPTLLEIERQILKEPGSLGIYECNVLGKRYGDIEDFKTVEIQESVNHIANDFYQARKSFFDVVRLTDEETGVIETTDLHSISDEAHIYAQKYLILLKEIQTKIKNAAPSKINSLLRDYAQVMRIDTVLLRVGPSESPMDVLLLAPTHPLRILWLFQYESLVNKWIDKMDGRKKDDIQKLISVDSIDKLVNLNIPNAISFKKSKTYINTDNLDLFWSMYPDADTADLRTAVNAARQAVGANRSDVMVSTVTPNQIAEKIERYLCHHPYVQTLKVNVINPGDGALLLEAIKSLLEINNYENLNFDIKFFAPESTRQELVGDAFDDFMVQRKDGEWEYGLTLSVTEEKLLQPNENPLFPKLVYAKYYIKDLLNLDEPRNRFESHLTFLIDYFGTTVATRAHDSANGSSSLYNLFAEYLTDYSSGENSAVWSRLIAPNKCPELVSDGITNKLHQIHDLLSHLAASFFDFGLSLDKYVTVQLELTDEDDKHHLKLLRGVHRISDWVFTIDRNFGIEYYDDPSHPAAGSSKGYLIDYTPEFLDAVSHRMIISTYHEQEIESILKSGFAELLKKEDGSDPIIETPTVRNILHVLKSVSGKLALKLINNPTQASEVIGLALTRLALKDADRLKGKILIPVDSHLDLFFLNKKELENRELSLKRTDLMLIELTDRKMTVELIEVKNRRYSSPAAQIELQTAICDKNKNSEEHFVANFVGTDETSRFDSDIKNKQLANILIFYFERARRYGLFSEDGEGTHAFTNELVEKFHKGIEAIEAGNCEVSFKHEGFIFNGSSVDSHNEKEVRGNRINTFGQAGVRHLLGLVIDHAEPSTDKPVLDDSTGTDNAPVAEHGEEAPKPTHPSEPTGGSSLPEQTPDNESDSMVITDPAPENNEISAEVTDTNKDGDVESSTKRPPIHPPGTSSQPIQSQPSAQIGDRSNINIYLGKNTTTGEEVFWNPHTKNPRRLTNQHLMVVGKSGSGKSETTKSIIWELDRLGVPSIILDYQGEYAIGEFHDYVNPQVFNVMDGLPINPFELPYDPVAQRRRSPLEMVYRLADTLNTVFRGSGEIQLGLLRESIEECYQQAGFDFQDTNTWEREAPTLEMLSAVLDIKVQTEGAQARNLQIRLQPLFQSGIFQDTTTNFRFDDLFKQTSVILMTAGIKDLMLAASRFILERVYSEMLIKGMTKELRVMLVIDEAHKLCGDETIISLVKEARKYGLGLILSSQETRDFHESVFANTGTLIGLGLESADANVIAKFVESSERNKQTIVRELILNQSCGQGVIRSQHFLPYIQAQVKSFEDRVEELEELEISVEEADNIEPTTGTIVNRGTTSLFQGYRLLQNLPIAGMSEAYKAEVIETGETVFLKRVRTQSADKAALQREASIYDKLLRIESKHIARFIDFHRDDDFIFLVTEFAEGGDLHNFVQENDDGRGLSTAVSKLIATGLARALKEFHDHEIVHRDLKPRNVLRFGEIWKLTDFGIAKNLARPITMKTFQQHGTRGYTAPEQFEGAIAASSADIYSFGKILAYLLTAQTDVDVIPYPGWSQLARKCTYREPDSRPTIEAVLSEIDSLPG
ncbi:protein kinase domain-containing protein [Gimesia maris]|uniref:protein kinase domain-containing protein n=1 Tax=Gimesia maris TaxID=122 RepID=UPI0032EDF72B